MLSFPDELNRLANRSFEFSTDGGKFIVMHFKSEKRWALLVDEKKKWVEVATFHDEAKALKFLAVLRSKK